MAADCCLYNSQNFAFVKLPDAMTTGSSIMPHKKNPDVFELIRARCNKICAAPNTLRMVTTNLPSGYFRDMQVLKEVFLPLFGELADCLDIAAYAIGEMQVADGLMEDPRYRLAFSVEEVNDRVAAGVPFRDAYKAVGMEIREGSFDYHGELHHTHEGSIGNLCNDRIAAKFARVLATFTFDRVHTALAALLA